MQQYAWSLEESVLWNKLEKGGQIFCLHLHENLKNKTNQYNKTERETTDIENKLTVISGEGRGKEGGTDNGYGGSRGQTTMY